MHENNTTASLSVSIAGRATGQDLRAENSLIAAFLRARTLPTRCNVTTRAGPHATLSAAHPKNTPPPLPNTRSVSASACPQDTTTDPIRPMAVSTKQTHKTKYTLKLFRKVLRKVLRKLFRSFSEAFPKASQKACQKACQKAFQKASQKASQKQKTSPD